MLRYVAVDMGAFVEEQTRIQTSRPRAHCVEAGDSSLASVLSDLNPN